MVIGGAEPIEIRPITGLDLKGREQLIGKAREHLKQAAMMLRVAESPHMEPFRVSKIINIMAKAAYVDYCILDALLGDIKRDRISIELRTHAAMLFIAQMEDENA
jgi:hypothetical protein